MGSVSGRKRGNRYLVSWRLEDGSQGGRTVDTPDEARDLAAQKRLEMRRGTWRGRQRGRLSFSAWATEWWETWAADDPSPTSLASAESQLRLHLRPWFADRPIDKITPADVRRWQAHLDRNVGPPATVAQCRSLALRIFQFAMERERSTPTRSARCPRSSAELTLRRSSARSSVGRSAPRRPAATGLRPAVLVGPPVDPTGLRFGELAGHAGAGSSSSGPFQCSRLGPPGMRPAGSAVASSRGPRATPASARCRWPRWWSRRSAVSFPPAVIPMI
jgi:Phage integrase, N-terminal SAM-like domain